MEEVARRGNHLGQTERVARVQGQQRDPAGRQRRVHAAPRQPRRLVARVCGWRGPAAGSLHHPLWIRLVLHERRWQLAACGQRQGRDSRQLVNPHDGSSVKVPMRLNYFARPAAAAALVLAVSGVSEAAGAARQAAPAPAPAGQQPPPAQPVPKPPASPVTATGEPTSVQETYEDWVVVCAQRDGKKVCALTQQQTDRASQQRVLAVELNAVTADKAEGTLVLPFGLAVSKEVTLQ